MVIPVALFYLFSVSVSTIHFNDGFVLIALLPFDILCFSRVYTMSALYIMESGADVTGPKNIFGRIDRGLMRLKKH